MIEKATLFSDENTRILDIQNHEIACILDCSELKNTSQFDIKIEFTSKIVAFRNHDYTWVDLVENRMAANFSPKIIILENSVYVQPNRNDGIWVTDCENHKILYWKFNSQLSKPITKYRGNSNAKTIVQATSTINLE